MTPCILVYSYGHLEGELAASIFRVEKVQKFSPERR